MEGNSVHLHKLLGDEQFVRAAKRVGVHLMQLAAPETADVVSGGKKFEKVWEDKQLGSVSKAMRVILAIFI